MWFYLAVIYDLAIAKIAKKIQNKEPDELKDVLIILVHFTLRKAYFLLLVNLLKGLEVLMY